MPDSRVVFSGIAAAIALITLGSWGLGTLAESHYQLPTAMAELLPWIGLAAATAFALRTIAARETDRELALSADALLSVFVVGGIGWMLLGARFWPVAPWMEPVIRGSFVGLIAGILSQKLLSVLRSTIRSTLRWPQRTISDAQRPIDPFKQTTRRKLSDVLKRPIDPFKQTTRRKLSDVLSGLWHGLQRRDRLYDPIQAYKDYLLLEIWAYNSDNKVQINACQRRIDRLTRNRATTTDSAAATIQRLMEEVSAKLTQAREAVAALESGTEDFIKTEAIFDKWQKAVGRPPFTEKFESLVSNEKLRSFGDKYPNAASQFNAPLTSTQSAPRPDTEPQTHLSHIWKIVRRVTGIATTSFIPIAVPAELLFTYPAFQLLVSDDKKTDFVIAGHSITALAASLVFTLALVKIGDAIGSYLGRAIDCKFDETDTKLLKTIDVRATVATVMLFCFAIYGTSVAASLRSIVPQKNQLQSETSFQSALYSGAEGSSMLSDNDEAAPPRPTANDAFAAFKVRYTALFEHPFDFFHRKDGNVAFVIYMTLIITAAIQRRFSTDPILPYHIIAQAFAEEFNKWQISLRNAEVDVLVWEQIHRAQSEQNDNLKSNNYDAIASLASTNNEISDHEQIMDTLRSDVDDRSDGITLYINTRSKRYAAYYVVLRFDAKMITDKISKHFAT